jgi:hypothetical protein
MVLKRYALSKGQWNLMPVSQNMANLPLGQIELDAELGGEQEQKNKTEIEISHVAINGSAIIAS